MAQLRHNYIIYNHTYYMSLSVTYLHTCFFSLRLDGPKIQQNYNVK